MSATSSPKSSWSSKSPDGILIEPLELPTQQSSWSSKSPDGILHRVHVARLNGLPGLPNPQMVYFEVIVENVELSLPGLPNPQMVYSMQKNHGIR